MQNPSSESFDVFGEASKALLEVMLGTDQTDQLAENMLDYSQLLKENNSMKEEVASLKENLPFKDKYENLSQEFRKVAKERDSLRAQELEFSRFKIEYERMKGEYQSTKGQLATAEKKLEDLKSSISPFSALEAIYKAFEKDALRHNVDIRWDPCDVNIQFIVRNKQMLGRVYSFHRAGKSSWSKRGSKPVQQKGDG